MLKRFPHLTVILLCLSLFLHASPVLQDRGNIDLILLVDLSKSMRGVGGTANIFGRVQKTSTDLVRELKAGDTVTLVPFADAARSLPTITIYGDAERERLFEMIEELEAEGNWTHTAEALRLGLEEAARLEEALPEHRRIVFILTDGLNDPPPGARDGGPTLQDMARPYANKPWYVYQVQYGAEVDEALREAIEHNFPEGGTITDRDAGGGIEPLRPVIERPEPEPEPEPLTWNAHPEELSVALDEPGVPVERSLQLELPGDLGIEALRVEVLRDGIPEAIHLRHELVAGGQGQAMLNLTAMAEQALQNATHHGTIRIELASDTLQYTAAPLEIPLEVRASMVPPTWPYWLAGILGALLLLGGAFYMYRRRHAQQLVGTLAYGPQDGSQPQKSIPLGRLGKEAVIGSQAIPLGGKGEAGRLFTRKVDGRYQVVVRPEEGKRLTFDGKATVELPLYNGDAFVLEGWEFQYRGPVPRRPRGTGPRRRTRNV